MWGRGGRFPQSLIHFCPGGGGGGGGGLLDKVLYWGRLCPEVKRLTLSYTIFDGKGTPPRFVYLLLTNGSPFHVPSFFFWTFSQPGFLPAFSKFPNTHSLCRDCPAFTLSSMRKSNISAQFFERSLQKSALLLLSRAMMNI